MERCPIELPRARTTPAARTARTLNTDYSLEALLQREAADEERFLTSETRKSHRRRLRDLTAAYKAAHPNNRDPLPSGDPQQLRAMFRFFTETHGRTEVAEGRIIPTGGYLRGLIGTTRDWFEENTSTCGPWLGLLGNPCNHPAIRRLPALLQAQAFDAGVQARRAHATTAAEIAVIITEVCGEAERQLHCQKPLGAFRLFQTAFYTHVVFQIGEETIARL